MQRYRRGHNGMDSKSIVWAITRGFKSHPLRHRRRKLHIACGDFLFYRKSPRTHCAAPPPQKSNLYFFGKGKRNEVFIINFVKIYSNTKFLLTHRSWRLFYYSKKSSARSLRRSSSQNLSYSGASDFVNRVCELSIFVATFL